MKDETTNVADMVTAALKKPSRLRGPRVNLNAVEQSVMAIASMSVEEGGYAQAEGLSEVTRMISRLFHCLLQGEMDAHLRQERGEPWSAEDLQRVTYRYRRADPKTGEKAAPSQSVPLNPTNKRNGYTTKKVKTLNGLIEVSIPRDRLSTFQPLLIPKNQRRLNIDGLVLAMYAKGLSTHDIEKLIMEAYHYKISASLVSTITKCVYDELKVWTKRKLKRAYVVGFFDAIRIKIRDETGQVITMSIHIGIGVAPDGSREVLGLWVAKDEGAGFWKSVFEDLKKREVEDFMMIVTDGLQGMSEAIHEVYPDAIHQTCIVHLVRSSMAHTAYQDRPEITKALRRIYEAETEEAGLEALAAFEASELGQRYPQVAEKWRRFWPQVRPLFCVPSTVRDLIYTTNIIEGLNRGIRKVVKTRTQFPHEQAALKVIFLAIKSITAGWSTPSPHWQRAMKIFVEHFKDRLSEYWRDGQWVPKPKKKTQQTEATEFEECEEVGESRSVQPVAQKVVAMVADWTAQGEAAAEKTSKKVNEVNRSESKRLKANRTDWLCG